MNNVSLVGRLTKDPELRSISDGRAVVNMNIAVNRVFTNANHERVADFIPVVVWNRQAENLVKYCSKGSQIAVTGRIQTRNYDHSDGTKRYVTEVLAESITFLSSKNDGTSNTYNTQGQNDNETQTSDINDDPFKDFGSEVVLSDDDLPF
ncbi:MAG: single-stranded DNA-binding protein [Bacilli bacterium]|nr:single-stranded DNA-binding protein [Bacilli bacterium]MDD4407125.1 single-stranded DNA-binding protein [Bacilli bacterium]